MITGVTIVLIAAGSYAVYTYLQPSELAEQVIYGNGHVELDEVRVAAQVAGTIVDNRIAEGRKVEKGDLLVAIDDSDLRLQKTIAEATTAAARAERARLKAELSTAQHHLASAQADVERARELEAKGTASPVAREQAENALAEAKGSVTALSAQIDASDANIDALNGKVALLVDQIAKTQVKAPIDGTVLTEAVEGGEFVQVGQVVAILGDLTHAKLRVYVQEAELGRLHLGAAARVAVDAFPGRTFKAQVARVDSAAQFTPRDIHMPQERTRTVFGVTLAIDNPEGVLKPGMPADAWILWRPEDGWPTHLFVPKG